MVHANAKHAGGILATAKRELNSLYSEETAKGIASAFVELSAAIDYAGSSERNKSLTHCKQARDTLTKLNLELTREQKAKFEKQVLANLDEAIRINTPKNLVDAVDSDSDSDD